jgi:hypothetical protein
MKYIILENTRRRGIGSRNFLVRLCGPNLWPPPRNTKKKHAPTQREGKTGETCERKKRTQLLQNSYQYKPQKSKTTTVTLRQNNTSPKGKDEREGETREKRKEKGRRTLNHGSILDTNYH